MIKLLPAAALLLAAASTSALAAPSREAAAFGAREFIGQISLSPDGTKVAIVSPLGARGAQLLIADPMAGGAPKSILRSSGQPEQLRSCSWATDTRLVCYADFISDVGGQELGFTRTIALNSDGSALKVVTADNTSRSLGFTQYGGRLIDWLGDSSGGVLMTRSYVPEYTIGTRLASSAEGLGVERVNTLTLARSRVEPARPGAVEYITDGRGTVRVMGLTEVAAGGQMSGRISYLYRKAGQRDWEQLGTLQTGDGLTKGFNPYAVDHAKNVVYGFDRLDGRLALYRIALDGSLKRELVLARPDVDVDSLIRIGREDRVVGVSYATDTRQAEFFDPELRALRVALEKALPAHPLVTFVDASADEKMLLLHAGSDTDPGQYYLFDKKTRSMTEVLPNRPQLAGAKLGTMKPVRFPAADGTMIPGYLTLPAGSDGRNLPAIVMPHGGPGARDEWGFDWWAQFFATRGFAVLQPNFRGSTGYGADWFQKNGFQSWRTAVGDVNDAGRWLKAEGIAAPDKLAIVGWSYGGYAALQSAVLDANLFKAIVAVAPVTDLDMLRDESSGYSNHALVKRFIGQGPHIREGSPSRNANAIKAPVLLFHGDRDQNVGIRQSRVMRDRLKEAGKQVELIEYKGLDHQLEDSTQRAEMLEKSDAFLRKTLEIR